MNAQTAKAIRSHFEVWSGGSPPESDHEIFVYVEAACPFDADWKEVWDLLKVWMREAENDTFRYVDGFVTRDSSESR